MRNKQPIGNELKGWNKNWFNHRRAYITRINNLSKLVAWRWRDDKRACP